MNTSHVLALLLASLACQTVLAAPVYKSVDSAGRVTYSSTPPAGAKVEKMDLPATPSATETQQAAEQVKKTEAQARDLETQRLAKEAEQKAKEEKEAEEARLREAQKPQTPAASEQPVYYPPPIFGGAPNLPPIRPLPTPVPRPR